MRARSFAERVADVREVLAAARDLAAAPPPLVFDLSRATGLTPEGVVLGLAEHLETEPNEAELSAFVAQTTETSRVHVVLSANVFVAALRAIALAVAAAPEVTVRPSSREPHFARALVARANLPGLCVTPCATISACATGELHVYGRDETIAAIRSLASPNVLVRGHGAGLGIAVVEDDAPVAESAAAIARDVIAFDQRGCLSPRIVFVTTKQSGALLAALSDALAALERMIPRGALHATERADAERYASTVAFAGELVRGPAHLVGCSSSLLLPPSGRHVHLVRHDDLRETQRDVGRLAMSVVAIGASHPSRVARWAPPHARISALGRMQRPPLDGAVDGRR